MDSRWLKIVIRNYCSRKDVPLVVVEIHRVWALLFQDGFEQLNNTSSSRSHVIHYGGQYSLWCSLVYHGTYEHEVTQPVKMLNLTLLPRQACTKFVKVERNPLHLLRGHSPTEFTKITNTRCS